MSWKLDFPIAGRYYETAHGILYHGDTSALLPQFPKESIDLVLTDPPYGRAYFRCYKYLANLCPRVMKDGASLLVIVGHYALEDVVMEFNGKLKYRWVMCLNQEKGPHPRMAMGIEVLWKPVLWYVKRAYPRKGGFFRDMVTISYSKEYHKWQQDLTWALFFISKLTEKDDLVLDPFVGSGTVALACEQLGRRWIGIDIDERACRITKDRLNNSLLRIV